jgi:hypothetical protein
MVRLQFVEFADDPVQVEAARRENDDLRLIIENLAPLYPMGWFTKSA